MLNQVRKSCPKQGGRTRDKLGVSEVTLGTSVVTVRITPLALPSRGWSIRNCPWNWHFCLRMSWIWLCPRCPGPSFFFFCYLGIPSCHLIHSQVTHVSLELRFQDSGEGTASESHVLDQELTFALSALSLLGSAGQSWRVGDGGMIFWEEATRRT